MTKRAFTLVELLVVVGIMATMATMSIGGYFAIARGMADRGAISTATSVISLAQERARMDLVPTAVYFYNEAIQFEDRNKGTAFVAAGVAIAVRRSGRISRITGDLLCDEFGDLDITYGLADDSGPSRGDTFRLYRFNTGKMEYSSVFSEAVEDTVDNETYLVEQPVDRQFKKANGDREDPNEIVAYAFRKAGDGNASWKVGDAYGYEFARIRLPDNYIFGSPSDVPTDKDPIKVLNKVIECRPDSNGTTLSPVSLSARRPSGWTSIGDTKDEMKDI
jgi:prepilin-type N-terminal cleavage/methylation domain-containing protein